MHPVFQKCTRLSGKCTLLFWKCTLKNLKCTRVFFLGAFFSIKIWVLSHNSTLILIESGYCYFYQKPQYFWAFQRFKADLGSSRDRPFLRLWGFHPISAKLGFVGFFSGSLVLWVGSLVLSLGSLNLWGVRWFLGKFVGFVTGSLKLWGVRWLALGVYSFQSVPLHSESAIIPRIFEKLFPQISRQFFSHIWPKVNHMPVMIWSCLRRRSPVSYSASRRV